MQKIAFIIACMVFCFFSSFAQNTVVTDSAAYSAENSAILDVQSVHKGFLVPRLSSSQRINIVSPANGLMVYDTTLDQFFIYSGGAWTTLSKGSAWVVSGDSIYTTGNGKRIGIGTKTPASRLTIMGDSTAGAGEALFEVKNSSGESIFAVYENEVQVNFKENLKGVKGGFAVGGLTPGKSEPTEYMRITPDSVRIYVTDSAYKGVKGGFAVGGLTPGKSVSDHYLTVLRDSVRVYVEDNSKGVKGGFAVGGLTPGKAAPTSFLDLTPNNYFIGHKAGEANNGGLYNLFLGYESGQLNQDGDANVFMGYQAGFSHLGDTAVAPYYFHGERNIFIGHQAGFNSKHSDVNVFIGAFSGYHTIDADANVFVGYAAGRDNQDNALQHMGPGYYNTYIGYQAGMENQVGQRNTFLGIEAGRYSEGGMYNILLGRRAGQHLSGDHNVYIGTDAGSYPNQETSGSTFNSGSNNVSIGAYSGRYIESGSNNVFIGHQAGYDETGSYKLYINNGTEDSEGSLIYGEFDNQYIRFNASANITQDLTVGLDATVAGDMDVSGTITGNVQGDLNGNVTGTINNMSIGPVHASANGNVITMYNDLYVLYWDKTAGELEIQNSSTDYCDYWWQSQKGTTVEGRSGAVAPFSSYVIISGTNSNDYGFEIHFGQADGTNGYCSVWLQYANGYLTGHYLKY